MQCHCGTEVQWPELPLQQVKVRGLLPSSVHQKASSPSEGATFFPVVAEGPGRDWAPDGGGTGKHLRFDGGWPALPAHAVLSQTRSRACHCQFLRRHSELFLLTENTVGTIYLLGWRKRGGNSTSLIALLCHMQQPILEAYKKYQDLIFCKPSPKKGKFYNLNYNLL